MGARLCPARCACEASLARSSYAMSPSLDARARPRGRRAISSTAATGSLGRHRRQRPSARRWQRCGRWSRRLRTKIMSSGISVFFIQKLDVLRRIEREDHAPVGRQLVAEHQARRSCCSGVRATSTVKRCVSGRSSESSAAPGRRPAGELRRASHGALCADGWRAAGEQPATSADCHWADQPVRGARPRSGPCGPRRSAPRSGWPGCRSEGCAARTVSMWTKMSSPLVVLAAD